MYKKNIGLQVGRAPRPLTPFVVWALVSPSEKCWCLAALLSGIDEITKLKACAQEFIFVYFFFLAYRIPQF